MAKNRMPAKAATIPAGWRHQKVREAKSPETGVKTALFHLFWLSNAQKRDKSESNKKNRANTLDHGLNSHM